MQGRHGILNVTVGALDRLQHMQMHPIIVVVRMKSAKQLKEMHEHITGR